MRVGILGAGAWGTALAILSEKAGNNTTLWSYDGQHATFDGVQTPKTLQITKEMSAFSETEIWLVATPAAYFRETINSAKPFFHNQPIIICTKGLEVASNKFMSEIITEELPVCRDFGVLSGPQFANEVANGVPTGSTLAGNTTTLARGRKVLDELYLQESDDVIGTEICGVGKNAIALIAGYQSIRARGENERALIFTRAWSEIVNIGLANGAKIETFLGLCGIGDLFLSATSKTSRNFSAGAAIAAKQVFAGTVEGIAALNGLIMRAIQNNINIPTLNEMQAKMKI